MAFYKKFLIGLFLVVVFFTVNYVMSLFVSNHQLLLLVKVASVVISGLYFLIIITDGLRDMLGGKGNVSIVIPNIVKYLGYIMIFVVALSIFGVTSAEAIAGGTFAGLVIGLALQPVLQNFFAGLLIMGTGYISIGDHVRIMSTKITYTPVLFPQYKYFSRDFIEQGIEGDVVEIDLFFSRILLENGREIRIPNYILLESSVIDYTSKYSKDFVVSIRVEFPLNKVDLERIEQQIVDVLKGYEIIEGPFLSEQSDKEHVILTLKVRANVNEWKKVKSEVLKRLLLLRKKIVES
ncbi:mechanosensitive ion channel family protein [Stygiolobus azoricus]|uniref:Mechanosensitive ion channel n=1 Tax=Stygiolobus azoricus TaxID=41675 RepID=A0A650CRN6_9CREN|nr:mechanosensitive ion channel family protein [Stygiolobus azoricus]QGR20405.1 mechanosensitive ion channel [Stygiolobus azoricus]